MTTYVSPTAFTCNGQQAGTLFTQGWYRGIKDLRDALVACGMVQTNDTGQQDFTLADGSSTTPATLVTYGDGPYFIVRMNDALQATKPFFMKIRPYQWYGGNPYNSGWRVTLGTGTDGAGNITGAPGSITTQAYIQNSASSSNSYSSQRVTYASGNGSEIGVCWHDAANTQNEGFYLSIERTRGDSGGYDGEGVLVQFMYPLSPTNAGPYVYHYAFPTNGNTTPLGYGVIKGINLPRFVPDRATFNVGNDIGPMIPFGGGFFPKFRQTHVSYLYPANDIPTIGSTFVMPVLGVNRTFRVMGNQYSQYNAWAHSGGTQDVNTPSTIYYQAMMWE